MQYIIEYDGQQYAGFRRAAKVMGVHHETLRKAAIEEGRRSCKGQKFKIVNKRYGAANAKKVICKDTDDVYDSLTAAAEDWGVSPRAISYAIQKGYHCAGCEWAYV